MLATNWNARGVDLRVTGIREERAFLVCAPRRGDVATLRIRGKKKHIAIAARGENNGVCCMGRNRSVHHVAHDDAFGVTIDDYDVEHLGAREHLDGARTDLPAQRLVSAEQQLLTSLAASVKSSRDLCAAERAIRQQSAVFASEWHALRDALVDNVYAHLRQPIDVRFTR